MKYTYKLLQTNLGLLSKHVGESSTANITVIFSISMNQVWECNERNIDGSAVEEC